MTSELEQILLPSSFHVAPLRFHKRDLPHLVAFYLHRFGREYGKKIRAVAPETLGILMNYDWPGNLTELSTVIQRAVMLARDDELLSDHILLGLPKSEGKWEFNLLRLGWIRKMLESRLYPALPSALVGIVLLVVASLLGGIVELGLRTPFAQRSRAIRTAWVTVSSSRHG